MSVPRTPLPTRYVREIAPQLSELFAQAQAEISELRAEPLCLKRLSQLAKSSPECVILLGFLKPPALPEIKKQEFELVELVDQYNQTLLATGVYTLKDYTNFQLNGLAPNS